MQPMPQMLNARIDVATALMQVKKARMQLILSQCFFGNLALRLQLIADPSISSMTTNGESLRFSPLFVARLGPEHLKAVMAHEVLHCALGHHERMKGRDHEQWNIACDHVVNNILIDAGFSLPEGRYCDRQYRKMSAEQVYGILGEGEPESGDGDGDSGNDSDGNAESHGDTSEGDSGSNDDGQDSDNGNGTGNGDDSGDSEGDNGSGGQSSDSDGESSQNGSNGNGTGNSGEDANYGNCGNFTEAPEDNTSSEADWKVAAAQAARAAKSAGSLPGSLQELVQELISAPVLSWQDLLRQFVATATDASATWMRPNRRYAHSGLYLPGHERTVSRLVVAIDTSGSVSSAELQAFLEELGSILDEMPARVSVLMADTQVNSQYDIDAGEGIPADMKCSGCGGTLFAPTFDYVEDEGEHVDGLIYFTDGYPCDNKTSYREQKFEDPGYPVLWITTRCEDFADFGQVAKLDVPYN